jgi:hypothetical protein
MNKGTAFWMGHVAAIRREGISTNAYAKRHGIAVKRLYYWQRKAAIAVSAGSIQPGAFVALRVESPVGALAPNNCTLLLASGVRLEMGNLPSPEWLAALDRAMQGAH